MSNFYIGKIVETGRQFLYMGMNELTEDCPWVGRLAGLAISPINALILAVNLLAAIADTVIMIWRDIKKSCIDAIIGIFLLPIYLAVYIPLCAIEGTIGLIYDIFAAIIDPEQWVNKRVDYHGKLTSFEGPATEMWIKGFVEADGLVRCC